jgi:hypothetical protein
MSYDKVQCNSLENWTGDSNREEEKCEDQNTAYQTVARFEGTILISDDPPASSPFLASLEIPHGSNPCGFLFSSRYIEFILGI